MGSIAATLAQNAPQRTVAPSSLSDCGNRKQSLAASSQILPIFHVSIEHIDSQMGAIWVKQADFRPI